MAITKVRYAYISKIIFQLILKFSVAYYPLDIELLVQNLNELGYNIQLGLYSEYANTKCFTIPYLINNIFFSNEAATVFIKDSNMYLIFYNDTINSIRRIRWTLAHEIGHIILKHHIIAYDNTKAVNPPIMNTDIFEQEANWFAKLLLCHPMVLSNCNIDSYMDIKKICDISNEASENRLNEIHSPDFLKHFTKWDEKTLHLFKNFLHMKICQQCGYIFIREYAIFCPSCANKTIKWYFNNTISENKIEFCYECGNTEISNSSYCKICGQYLTNVCSYCNEACGPNDLFCSLCSNETLYYKYDLQHNNKRSFKYKTFNIKTCFLCGNTIAHNNRICNKCNLPIGNFCISEQCHNKLVGNARYCHKCGRESLFNVLGLLKHWEIER